MKGRIARFDEALGDGIGLSSAARQLVRLRSFMHVQRGVDGYDATGVRRERIELHPQNLVAERIDLQRGTLTAAQSIDALTACLPHRRVDEQLGLSEHLAALVLRSQRITEATHDGHVGIRRRSGA